MWPSTAIDRRSVNSPPDHVVATQYLMLRRQNSAKYSCAQPDFLPDGPQPNLLAIRRAQADAAREGLPSC
jgi:hypothetical protein